MTISIFAIIKLYLQITCNCVIVLIYFANDMYRYQITFYSAHVEKVLQMFQEIKSFR
jgi:hypothetical protein